jgi:hypothetical protein
MTYFIHCFTAESKTADILEVCSDGHHPHPYGVHTNGNCRQSRTEVFGPSLPALARRLARRAGSASNLSTELNFKIIFLVVTNKIF